MITIFATGLCLVGFWFCTPLAAQTTNGYFVIDESVAPYKEEPATTEQISKAKLSKECRTAIDDPEGHWGRVTEGFQASIRFSSDVFTNEQPVIAMILLRNVSTNKLWYPLSYGVDRQTSFVLKRDHDVVPVKGAGKAGTGFEARLRNVQAGSDGLCPSLVGTQRRFLFDLRNMYELTPGNYSVEVRRKVTDLNRSKLVEVVSGQTAFRVVAEPSGSRAQ